MNQDYKFSKTEIISAISNNCFSVLILPHFEETFPVNYHKMYLSDSKYKKLAPHKLFYKGDGSLGGFKYKNLQVVCIKTSNGLMATDLVHSDNLELPWNIYCKLSLLQAVGWDTILRFHKFIEPSKILKEDKFLVIREKFLKNYRAICKNGFIDIFEPVKIDQTPYVQIYDLSYPDSKKLYERLAIKKPVNTKNVTVKVIAEQSSLFN